MIPRDLVEQAQHNSARAEITAILESVDERTALAVRREIIVAHPQQQIERYPLDLQKQIVALLTHQLLTQWRAA